MKKKDTFSDLFQPQRMQGISLNNEYSINAISKNTQDIPDMARLLVRISDILWIIVILLIINLFV